MACVLSRAYPSRLRTTSAAARIASREASLRLRPTRGRGRFSLSFSMDIEDDDNRAAGTLTRLTVSLLFETDSLELVDEELMNGKTVVVFGGSSGIGEATGLMAKAAGARVIVVGRDEGRLAAAAARIGGGVQTAVADATDVAAIERVFAQADVVDHV